jgi:hypothetical protein
MTTAHIGSIKYHVGLMCFDYIKRILLPDKLKQNIYFLAVLDLPVGGTIS